MASQGFRPAQGKCLECLFYLYRRVVLFPEPFTMKTDDVGYLIDRPQGFGKYSLSKGLWAVVRSTLAMCRYIIVVWI